MHPGFRFAMSIATNAGSETIVIVSKLRQSNDYT